MTGIPGIGLKTALFLIVIKDGFAKFENAKQLCSYVGTTFTIRESGSSVRGRSRIVKLVIESYETFCFCAHLKHVNITKGVDIFMSVS